MVGVNAKLEWVQEETKEEEGEQAFIFPAERRGAEGGIALRGCGMKKVFKFFS